jgi:hypothetical protein
VFYIEKEFLIKTLKMAHPQKNYYSRFGTYKIYQSKLYVSDEYHNFSWKYNFSSKSVETAICFGFNKNNIKILKMWAIPLKDIEVTQIRIVRSSRSEYTKYELPVNPFRVAFNKIMKCL